VRTPAAPAGPDWAGRPGRLNPSVPPRPGLVAAAPDEVAAAIERAGADNPLLGIGTGAGLPAGHLCSTTTTHIEAAEDLVEAVAAWLGHPERRVAASLSTPSAA
jgi:hypothetical protein